MDNELVFDIITVLHESGKDIEQSFHLTVRSIVPLVSKFSSYIYNLGETNGLGLSDHVVL